MPDIISNQPATTFASEYGTRLIFQNGLVNPRDELGKVGVTVHGGFSGLFYRTINVRMPLYDDQGQVKTDQAGQVMTERYRVNRSSLIEYINASRKYIPVDQRPAPVSRKTNDEDLVLILDAILSAPRVATADHLRHAGEHNQRKLYNVSSDHHRAQFFSWLYEKTIGSFSGWQWRFWVVQKEKDHFEVGEILAKNQFTTATETVPAYRKHLATIDPATAQPVTKEGRTFLQRQQRRFVDIPMTTHDNYKTPHKPWAQYQGGQLPKRGRIDTVADPTNRATVWRSNEELEAIEKSLRTAAETKYGKRKVISINTAVFTPGMTSSEIMRTIGVVSTPGADIAKTLSQLEDIYDYKQHHIINRTLNRFMAAHADMAGNELKRKILHTIVTTILNEMLDDNTVDVAKRFAELNKGKQKEFKSGTLHQHKALIVSLIRQMDKVQPKVVLTGDAQFLSDLVAEANKSGKDFKKYGASAVVVGSPFISEETRDHLIAEGFTAVNVSYGAADLDIDIGVEGTAEQLIRKFLAKTPAALAELCGPGVDLPGVFHFDPFHHHIESLPVRDSDGQVSAYKLVYTSNRPVSSPRIRHALGSGRVFANSDVLAVLKKHGCELQTPTNLPFLFVWEKKPVVVLENSEPAKAKVNKPLFADLEGAITRIDVDKACVSYAIYRHVGEEDNKTKYEIWVELAEGVEMPAGDARKAFYANLLVEMGRANEDFRSYTADQAALDPLPVLRMFKYGKSPIADLNRHGKQAHVITDKKLPAQFFEQLKLDKGASKVVKLTRDAEFAGLVAHMKRRPKPSSLVSAVEHQHDDDKKIELALPPQTQVVEVEVEKDKKNKDKRKDKEKHKHKEPKADQEKEKDKQKDKKKDKDKDKDKTTHRRLGSLSRLFKSASATHVTGASDNSGHAHDAAKTSKRHVRRTSDKHAHRNDDTTPAVTIPRRDHK